MDIRQLRYFVAVADSGSFSAAAAKLRISQPSIGQQVRNLEEELGTTLLQRHSRGIVLSPTGEMFIDLARDIIARVDSASRTIRDRSAEPFGEVRIGMTVSAAAPLAAPLVRAAEARFPRIRLSVTEALSHYLIELLEDDHLDLALAFIGDYPDGMRGEHLAEEDFHLCIPHDHPLAGAASVTMDEVLDFPLLLPPQSHQLRTQIDEAAATLGKSMEVKLVVQSIGLMVDFVEHGLGVTVLPYAATARPVSEGRVAAVPIIAPRLTRTMTLLHSARRPMNTAELAIRDILRELVRARVESGDFKWRAPGRAGR